jgi:hypothetical protein
MERDNLLVLFGAGTIGTMAARHYGSRNIRFFADNFKAGLFIEGIPVVSLNELKATGYKGPIIVSTEENLFPGIRDQLRNAGYTDICLFVPREEELFKRNPHLERFKNIHTGKRCFLIGNGPSLQVADLEKIRAHRDISFGFNCVFKAFGQTDWRPDYFIASDTDFLKRYLQIVLSFDFICFINAQESIGDVSAAPVNLDNVFFFRSQFFPVDHDKGLLIPQYKYTAKPFPSFSEDPSKFIYPGGTVVYIAMQWAVYMGFSDIILLGVDLDFAEISHPFAIPQFRRQNTAIRNDHFIKDYREKGSQYSVPDVERMKIAFGEAERYSRKHGFRIFNATRGGKLEVFERVDFEGLF